MGRHFRNEEETGAEMCPATISGMVSEDAPVSYWPIFSLFLITVPEVFAKVDSTQYNVPTSQS